LARIVSLPARPSSSAVTDPLGVKLGLMPPPLPAEPMFSSMIPLPAPPRC